MIAKYIVAYVSTLVVFLAIDSVWLTLTGTALYKATLGDILLPQFSVAPAAIFYLLYVVGILIFVTTPAFRSGDWKTALIYGALFGFFSYGVYDFTNMATLRNWTAQITIADLCWGTFLTGTASTVGFLITSWAGRTFNFAT
jgi:uncharacterized membrane protein